MTNDARPFPVRSLAAVAVVAALGLAGCDALDPTSLFAEKYEPNKQAGHDNCAAVPWPP